jgi:hypothetical protein
MRQTKPAKRSLKRQRQFNRSIAMEQRQIAYYYNGMLKTEETDLDLDGVISIPIEGEVLVRPGGNRWKVVKVLTRQDAGNAFPVYMIYMKLAQPN